MEESMLIGRGGLATDGSHYSDASAEPRRNLPERSENQAFPVIQAD